MSTDYVVVIHRDAGRPPTLHRKGCSRIRPTSAAYDISTRTAWGTECPLCLPREADIEDALEQWRAAGKDAIITLEVTE